MIGHSVTAASLYVDVMLIPLNPDRFSAKGLQILKDEIKNIKKQYKKDLHYKIFLNKFSGNTILSDKTLQTVFNDESESGNTLNTAVRLVTFGVDKKIGDKVKKAPFSNKSKYMIDQTVRKTLDNSKDALIIKKDKK
jgi:cellulose biosynthesis protein BcsQ